MSVEDKVAMKANEENISNKRPKLRHNPSSRIKEGRDEKKRNDVSHVFGKALQERNWDRVNYVNDTVHAEKVL